MVLLKSKVHGILILRFEPNTVVFVILKKNSIINVSVKK